MGCWLTGCNAPNTTTQDPRATTAAMYMRALGVMERHDCALLAMSKSHCSQALFRGSEDLGFYSELTAKLRKTNELPDWEETSVMCGGDRTIEFSGTNSANRHRGPG